jgi:hypothetical protein
MTETRRYIQCCVYVCVCHKTRQGKAGEPSYLSPTTFFSLSVLSTTYALPPSSLLFVFLFYSLSLHDHHYARDSNEIFPEEDRGQDSRQRQEQEKGKQDQTRQDQDQGKTDA